MAARKKPKSIHQRRVDKYKRDTGRQRISKEVREALKEFTPSEVKKGQKVPKSLLDKRLKQWEKAGGKVDESVIASLKYGTVSKVQKIQKTTSNAQAAPGAKESAVPTPEREAIKLGAVIRWTNTPKVVKKWPHKSGSWLYNAQAWYTSIDIDHCAENPNSYGGFANDHNNYDYVVEIVKNKYPNVTVEIDSEGKIKMYRR